MLQFTHVYVSLPSGSVLNRIKDTLLQREGKGRVRALEDITLWIGRGEGWAVLGENLSGKTTLLRLAARRIPPDSGLYSSTGSIASAIYGEEGFFKNETGEGNAKLSLIAEGLKQGALDKCLSEAKRLFADDGLFQKPLNAYTQSDKAKLSLCIALSLKPDALIIANQLEYCDKPFRQQCLFELRRRLRDGMTLLIESGDETLLGRLCDNAVWLDEGKLKRLGSLEHVLASMRVTAPGAAKQWLNDRNAAFSAPLAPAREKNAPDSENDSYTKRLHEQLHACSEANIRLEAENQRLEDMTKKYKARIDANEKLLLRLLTAFSQTLELMHKQFLALRAKEEVKRLSHAPKPY